MNKLTREFLIELNRMTIEENGGNFVPPFNLLHGEQLDYVVEAVDAEIFGQAMYPEIADKAAVYMFSIISNHVFSDGNKRTGLAAALVYLDGLGKELREDLTMNMLEEKVNGVGYDERLENFTLAVASGQVSLDECRGWFAANVVRSEW